MKKLKKEFYKKFPKVFVSVENKQTNVNPCVYECSQEVWQWIEEKLKEEKIKVRRQTFTDSCNLPCLICKRKLGIKRQHDGIVHLSCMSKYSEHRTD